MEYDNDRGYKGRDEEEREERDMIFEEDKLQCVYWVGRGTRGLGGWMCGVEEDREMEGDDDKGRMRWR